ncbi:MAG TPA: glycosyltransferase family 2 protein [bacterium]|nr:glycosyltransferase family 2 protein [bacterium]
MIGEILFWGSAGAIAWTSLGFPIVVSAWGLVRHRRVRQAPIEPKISVIVAAHNEEATIVRKIANTLELDYPSALLEIIVASDGSTDRTVPMARGFSDRGVRVLALPRSGKIPALNEAVASASGEILLFTDANTHLAPSALRKLVRNFADPSVGGVCGNQIVSLAGDEDSTARGESLYWGYDKKLKALESATGSIVSADGAIYAIRRNLYVRPANNLLNDDFAISTKVIERGKRLVFESEALAWETASASAEHEFERKVRILSRGFRSVIAARSLLNPLRFGFYSLVLFTHKVLRRLTPLFLAGLLAGSLLALEGGRFYVLAAILQLGFYAIAMIGWIARSTPWGKNRLIGAPFFFCLTNAAALVGLSHVISGKRIELWQPRRRGATP